MPIAPYCALLLALTLAATLPARSAEISSVYTDFEAERDCAVFAAADEDDGDWANMVCSGFRGYPVIIYYGDAREAIFYGFPPAGDLAPVWESFNAFNRAGPTIEWRILTDGRRTTPFATIHRWFVADPNDADDEIEVLVVEKVGQIDARQGCAVGYVMASGNSNANEAARRIADNRALDFACGEDQPVVEAGSIALPSFSRAEN